MTLPSPFAFRSEIGGGGEHPLTPHPDNTALWSTRWAYNPPGLPETVELCARLLELFEGRGIRVIRLGLHSEEGLSEQALAGCFHPALGELCRGLLLRQRIARLLDEKQPEGPPAVLVKPRLLSQALGQRREGLLALRGRWPGLVIRPEAGLEEDFRIG